MRLSAMSQVSLLLPDCWHFPLRMSGLSLRCLGHVWMPLDWEAQAIRLCQSGLLTVLFFSLGCMCCDWSAQGMSPSRSSRQ